MSLEVSTTKHHPRWLLQQELSRRTARNPHYSLRAFAKSLGTSHTALSFALSGKRPLSKNTTLKLISLLCLPSSEAKKTWESRDKNPFAEKKTEPETLEFEQFNQISEWYYYALLSLLEIPGARLEPHWVARQLKISPLQARLAIERLKQLGMIENKKGVWKQSTKGFTLNSKISTPDTRKWQTQIIQKSIESLENDAVELRDHTSITLAIAPEKIEEAKERIKEFRREFCKSLEGNGIPQAVYTLSIQFYPMSKTVKERK